MTTIPASYSAPMSATTPIANFVSDAKRRVWRATTATRTMPSERGRGRGRGGLPSSGRVMLSGDVNDAPGAIRALRRAGLRMSDGLEFPPIGVEESVNAMRAICAAIDLWVARLSMLAFDRWPAGPVSQDTRLLWGE